MALNIERFKKDLNDLKYRGMLLECSMIKNVKGEKELKEALAGAPEEQVTELLGKIPEFRTAYEAWYSEAVSVIRQVLPDRLDDFKAQYEKPKTRKDVHYGNYVISDYMIGYRVTRYGGTEIVVDSSAAIPKLQHQTAILAAVDARFKSSLFEIRQLVQADLFDSEVEAARHLLKNKFLRAAGAIAGVVLEKHLAQVCDDHNVKVIKKNPGISDLNELLKSAGVIDVPTWRHISMLGDIRNLCDHNKQKEPTEQQVVDLIDGTDKVLKTIA